MNKQQLANKIWASANKMRSKIEANEYKDYILGLIFYKFLSDNEVNYLKSIGWTDEDLVTLVEDHDNQEAVMMMEYCRNNIGYFIEYKNLFGTWLKPNSIIRKSKFPQNPKRSVRFSGKRTKRSVQKRKARNTQKAETKVL